jgi:hypothetical protein
VFRAGRGHRSCSSERSALPLDICGFDVFVFCLQLIEFKIAQILDSNHPITGLIDSNFPNASFVVRV